MASKQGHLWLFHLVTLSPCHLVILLSAGCSHPPPPASSIHVRPHVRLVRPERRTITHFVGQPGFIYAYEETSLYPKVAGYLEQWNVDIGDPIKKGEELARLYVPELVAELAQKKAQVKLEAAQVKVAEGAVEVASAQVQEAQATVNKYQSSVERWQSEVKRDQEMVNQRVLDPQVLDESRKQLKADTAARDAAAASRLASKAALDKARNDVEAAHARALVSQADEQRVAALVGYTHILAPYNGIVIVRNANTGDYLQPGSGDQSAASVPGQSATRLPLYVVARTDLVRVYVDVPEMDARSVARGTKADVRVQALGDTEIDATVTRTSWALRPQSRTLRAEIDLPNPDGRLRPGMYAYARVRIDRPNVWALPLAAVVEIGNHKSCFRYEDGKAVETPVEAGINDGKWIEVIRKMVNGAWTEFTGSEEVILGDLSELTDGQPVEITKESPPQQAPAAQPSKK
jgi:HlyD family secretion protein